MRALLTAACLGSILLAAPGCLVASLQPAYDDESLGWDPDLLGTWVDPDGAYTVVFEQDEWKSYRIEYSHTAETGTLTGYLTKIGEERYLDVMPERGIDRGSFLVPVHVLARVRLEDERLELAPLSYEWFLERVDGKPALPALQVARDQKQNVLITSSTARLRTWLEAQRPDGPMFGQPIVLHRRK